MADDPLAERFDRLLKSYKEKLDGLDLGLPALPEAPAPAAPTEEPVPPPTLPQIDIPPRKNYFPEEPTPAAPPEAQRPAEAPAAGADLGIPAPPPAQPLQAEPVAPAEEAAELPRAEAPAAEAPPWSEPAPAPGPEAPEPREPEPEARPAPAERLRRPRKSPGLWVAGLVLAAAAAWWAAARLGDDSGDRSFRLSPTAVRGSAWREGKLQAVDLENHLLLAFGPKGRRLESKDSFSALELTDLCWADGAFWSTEQGRSAIFQHDGTPEHNVRRIYATPGRAPAALAGDNEDIWAADARTPVVYRYLIGHTLNGVSLTPLNQYNLPGAPAAGLHAADGRLWVLDSQTRRLTRYSYDAGTLSAVDAAELGARLPAGAAVFGLTVGGDHLWVLTGQPSVLHRFALSRLSWQPAKP